MEKKANDVEICESCEVHENLLKIVNETIPAETELYDLAELFKIFGDSTRIRILYVLFEAEVCVCDLAEALNMTQSSWSRADGKVSLYSIHWQMIMCVRSSIRDGNTSKKIKRSSVIVQ